MNGDADPHPIIRWEREDNTSFSFELSVGRNWLDLANDPPRVLVAPNSFEGEAPALWCCTLEQDGSSVFSSKESEDVFQFRHKQHQGISLLSAYQFQFKDTEGRFTYYASVADATAAMESQRVYHLAESQETVATGTLQPRLSQFSTQSMEPSTPRLLEGDNSQFGFSPGLATQMDESYETAIRKKNVDDDDDDDGSDTDETVDPRSTMKERPSFSNENISNGDSTVKSVQEGKQAPRNDAPSNILPSPSLLLHDGDESITKSSDKASAKPMLQMEATEIEHRTTGKDAVHANSFSTTAKTSTETEQPNKVILLPPIAFDYGDETAETSSVPPQDASTEMDVETAGSCDEEAMDECTAQIPTPAMPTAGSSSNIALLQHSEATNHATLLKHAVQQSGSNRTTANPIVSVSEKIAEDEEITNKPIASTEARPIVIEQVAPVVAEGGDTKIDQETCDKPKVIPKANNDETNTTEGNEPVVEHDNGNDTKEGNEPVIEHDNGNDAKHGDNLPECSHSGGNNDEGQSYQPFSSDNGGKTATSGEEHEPVLGHDNGNHTKHLADPPDSSHSSGGAKDEVQSHDTFSSDNGGKTATSGTTEATNKKSSTALGQAASSKESSPRAVQVGDEKVETSSTKVTRKSAASALLDLSSSDDDSLLNHNPLARSKRRASGKVNDSSATKKQKLLSQTSATDAVSASRKPSTRRKRTTPRRNANDLNVSPTPRKTPRRGGAALAADVRLLVTGVGRLTSDQEKIVGRLGGEIITELSSAINATHVIAAGNGNPIKRTPKLMIALCRTPNIVSLDWLTKSSANGSWLPCEKFLINDRAAEERYQFSMQETLTTLKNNLKDNRFILDGWSIYICDGVAGKNAPTKDELQYIVEATGATWQPNFRSYSPSKKLLILTSDPETAKQISKKAVANALEQGALKRTIKWFFDATMTQTTDLDTGTNVQNVAETE